MDCMLPVQPSIPTARKDSVDGLLSLPLFAVTLSAIAGRREAGLHSDAVLAHSTRTITVWLQDAAVQPGVGSGRRGLLSSVT